MILRPFLEVGLQSGFTLCETKSAGVSSVINKGDRQAQSYRVFPSRKRRRGHMTSTSSEGELNLGFTIWGDTHQYKTLNMAILVFAVLAMQIPIMPIIPRS